ncbi:MAG: cytochrome P450 [Pseudomonadales bacterium]|nr:cytochrome P450 [Pseudomonadales bacterium]
MRTLINRPSFTPNEIVNALSSYDKPTIRRYQRSVKQPRLNHLPGSRGMPVIGNIYWILKDMHRWMNQEYERYGPVFTARMPVLSPVMMLGPDANRFVFQNEDKIFSNYFAWNATLSGLFDNNLLERDFRDHKTQRKILQQSFKRQSIEGHMDIMNPLLDKGVEGWDNGGSIRAMDYIKELLLSTGANVFLGVDMEGSEANRISQAFSQVVAAAGDPIKRKEIWFSPYAKGMRANDTLSDFILKEIPSRRHSQGKDFFSEFCRLRDENNQLFSDEVIRDHIMFLLFAAHDTTTSALSAILFALASDLKWQEELRQEMFALRDSKSNEELVFDDIDKLVKTGWTFKEALRMHPALAVMPRYALKDFEFNGHVIPKNTIVVVSSLFTHHMSEYWSNPYLFDPLRFSPDRAEDKKDFFQYVPFGGGAHKCIGMHFAEIQGKMFLYYLLRKYTVTKSPKMISYRYNNIPMTFPVDGLPLTFYRL